MTGGGMTEPDEILEPTEHLVPEERDPEAPAADAVEQATPADPSLRPDEVRQGLEVGEYDAVEQSRIVELDDEYR